MSWVTVGGGEYVSWKDRQPGEVGIEGWFLRPIKSVNFNHNNYEFLESSGGKKIVNGCGYVHKAMEDVRPGDYCRMTYLGEGVTSDKAKFKNKPQHMVRVQIDPSKRGIVQDGILVGMAPPIAATAAPIGSAAPVAAPAPAPAPAPMPSPTVQEEPDDLDW